MNFNIDKRKAVEALVYVASQFPGVGRFHAAKILYFAEMNHLRKYGRPIFGDRYIAMENGPVPSFAYDVLKGSVSPEDAALSKGALASPGEAKYPQYEAKREADFDVFSRSDLLCLDEAIAYCRPRSFGQISDETHRHPGWARAALNGPMEVDDILDGVAPEVREAAEEFAAYGVL